MFSVILFLFAFGASMVGMMLYEAKEEKISLIKSIILCLITELCLTAVMAGIYKIVNVSIGLQSMGIAYILIAAVLWGIILKNKRIQKFRVEKYEIYTVIVLLVFFVIVFIKTFTLGIGNVYRNSDPGVHYGMALNVLKTGEITTMYFAPVYNALVMEIFQPFLAEINLYKAFILADSFANLLNLAMFCVLGISFCKSQFLKRVLPFIGILYFCGWPFFNYIIGGFVYFGWGVTLFMYVVYWLKILIENQDKRISKIALINVLMGCFSVLVCYIWFVPLGGLIVLSVFIMTAKKRNIQIPKKLFTTLIIMGSVLIIGIFSICFFGFFKGNWQSVFEALQNDGGIQKDLYRDCLFLLPGAIYMLGYNLKAKKINVIDISLLFTISYIIITFVLCWCGFISPYYFYKTYYPLWVFLWIINMEAMECLYSRDRLIVGAYGGAMLFAVFMSWSGVDQKMAEKRIVIDEVNFRHYSSVVPIYDRMEIFISEKNDIADKNALIDICNNMHEMLEDEQDEVMLITDAYYIVPWYQVYSGYSTTLVGNRKGILRAIADYKETKNKYLLMYQNTEMYHKNMDVFEDYECIYNNGYYGIYRIQ